MIIWQGFGFLAVVIPFAILVAFQALLDSVQGEGFYMENLWPKVMAFLLSGALVYVVGDRLNNKPGKILIDPETNQQIELKGVHTMFWVPMQYWGIIIAIGGSILFLL